MPSAAIAVAADTRACEELGHGVGGEHAAHQQQRAAAPVGVRLLVEHPAQHGAGREHLGREVQGERAIPRVARQLVDGAVPKRRPEPPATAKSPSRRPNRDRCGHGRLNVDFVGQLGRQERGLGPGG